MTTPMQPTRQQFTPGAVRTATPFIIGLLGSWLTRQGLNINDDLLAAVLVPAYGFSYYLVARFLEMYASPKWAYILGFGVKPPVYVEPPAVVTDADGTRTVLRDGGEVMLGQLGVILLVIGLVLVVLDAVAVLAVSTGLWLLLLIVGVVLLLVGGSSRRR